MENKNPKRKQSSALYLIKEQLALKISAFTGSQLERDIDRKVSKERNLALRIVQKQQQEGLSEFYSLTKQDTIKRPSYGVT